MVQGSEGPTWQDKRKRRGAKPGRAIKAASRWHLQDMKLLPKSPLDSSPLRRGTGRGRGYFEESDPKQEFFSEIEQRGRRGREKEREADLAYAKK